MKFSEFTMKLETLKIRFLELEIRFLAHRSLIKTSTCITNWFCFRSKKEKNPFKVCLWKENFNLF